MTGVIMVKWEGIWGKGQKPKMEEGEMRNEEERDE
jgi:hypothetical protein